MPSLPSVLSTDGYKFTMATAGWPLRRETFYFSHRQHGPHYLPFDATELIQDLLPGPLTEDEDDWLCGRGHHMGGAWRQAIQGSVRVEALPRGSWFFDREPAFSITGPSSLVSWLEPLVVQLNYRIQLASLAKLDPEALPEAVAVVSCEAQAEIVRETLDAVGVAAPPIRVDSEGYVAGVQQRLQALIDIVGDPARIFEVGLRTATCTEQHHLVLHACHTAGIRATSHAHGARSRHLELTGCMGHEHVQRFRSDPAAFRALKERQPGSATFLLDTFSTLDSGIPAAFELMAEHPERIDGIRYDSGDKEGQYLYAAVRARSLGIQPIHVLEDGMDPEQTHRFETLRTFTEVPATNQHYGYGGYIVNPPENPLSRARVGAVYKLSQSGAEPTMKWGDAGGQGKESIPGRPVLWRTYHSDGSWGGLVSQPDEQVPGEATRLTGAPTPPRRVRFTVNEARRFNDRRNRPELSPQTQAMVDALYALRRDQT